MRRLSNIMMIGVMLAAHGALAAVTSSPVVVREGYFLAPDCKAEMSPAQVNECMCSADIRKIQLSGLAADVADKINMQLAQLPEKLARESCEGDPAAAPKAGISVNGANASSELYYRNESALTVLTSYSTMAAGAAHPLSGTEGFTFDVKSGQQVDPIALLKPEQLRAADAFIKQELLRKYPADLLEEAKTRTDPYLNENGCDTCSLFYGQDGWVVRFQIYSVAPYALGEPEVVMPADIIPSPEKLIATEATIPTKS